MKINLLPKKTWRQRMLKSLHVVTMLTFIFNMSMVGIFIQPPAAEAAAPSVFDGKTIAWTAYEINGHVVTDWEDGVCGINDDSNGGTNVTPQNVDLASNAVEGPPCENPGSEPTLQSGQDTDYLYFRIRLRDNPQQKAGSLYNSYHWDVLVDVDGNGTSDYVVDMNGSDAYGGNGSTYMGVLGVYPNDPGLFTYNPTVSEWQAEANNNSNFYTRVVPTGTQFWLDLAVPKTEIPFSSYSSLFASTSASNTNPLQKDWMASEGFFVELIKNKSVENVTNPGYTTVSMPVKPGDTLRYTLSVTNAGNIFSPGFIFEDDVSDIVEYTNDPFNISNSGSYNSGTEIVSWPQQTINAGATVSETFDVTIEPYIEWPVQGDFTASNVYGDYIDVPFCNLWIEKIADPFTNDSGQGIHYTLHYGNNGTAVCTGGGARIDDYIPAGTTYVSGSNTQSVASDTDGEGIHFGYEYSKFGTANPDGFNGSLLSWNGHVVSPGETGTVTFKVMVDPLEPCADVDITNYGTIYSNEIPDGIDSNIVSSHYETECNGSLKVTKYVDSGTATPDEWSFTINGIGTLTPNSGEDFVIFNDLSANSYTVTESTNPDYWQVSTTCNNVVVNSSQQSECNFHNTRQAGDLIVNKVDESGAPLDVPVHVSGTEYTADDTTGADGQVYFFNIPTGFYDVSEVSPAGYTAGGYECTVGGGPGLQVVASGSGDTISDLEIMGDYTITCTFTNVRDIGTIVVHKDVVAPDGFTDVTDNQSFTVKLDGANNETITESTTVTYDNLPTGNYVITEELIDPDYTLVSITNGGNTTVTKDQTTHVYIVNKQHEATITVTKDVLNPDGGPVVDTHQFEANVTGDYGYNSSDAIAEGNNATFNVWPGTYTVTETPDPDYDLVSITPSQVTVPSGGSETVDVVNKQKKATITVYKDVMDYLGQDVSDNHTFTLNGTTYSFSENNELVLTVNPGQYTFSEDLDPDYTLYTILGDNDADETNGAMVEVGSNGSDELTFINYRNIGTIVVNKFVELPDQAPIYNPGDWSWSLDSESGILGGEQRALLTNVTYAVTEDTSVYSSNDFTSSWICYDGQTEIGSGFGTSFNIESTYANQHIVCTFTNVRDTVRVTFDKVIVGGGPSTDADWDFTINGIPGVYHDGDYVTLPTHTGPYDVNESSVYDNLYSLTNAWGACYLDNGQIKLNIGSQDTCTPYVCYVENTRDAGKLIVIKDVVNDDGGDAVASDFTLHVQLNSVDVADSPAAGSETGKEYSLVTGTYTVSEDLPPTGYTQTSVICDGQPTSTVVVENGVTKTCTITNDDIAPTLTLIKHVINDDGGTKVVSDFPLFINGSPVTSGVANTVSANTLVTATETEDPGYAASVWSGDCAANGTITLQPGENKVCEITNDDKAPTLKLIKHVINDDGGTKVVSDFPLFINGSPVTSGVANTVSANTLVTATETEDPGYAASVWSGDCAANGEITLQPGENKVCEITNDDIAPELTIIKHVINDDGGQAVASDFTMNVTGTNVSNASFAGAETPGVTVTLDQGSYSVDEDSYFGYAKTLGADCSGTINVGETKTCTITNDDIPGIIRGYKMDQLEAPLNDWEICLSGGSIDLGDSISQDFGVNCVYTGTGEWEDGYYEFDSLFAGTYGVAETLKYGWTAINPASGAHTGIVITPGSDVRKDFMNQLNEFDVSIDKTADATVQAGNELTYTLDWSVTGNTDVSNVVISDPLPANTTFVSADNGGTETAGVVTWNLNTVTPDANGTVSFIVQVNTPLYNGTVIDNTAEICGEGELVVAADAPEVPTQKCDDDSTTTIVESQPAIGLVKEADKPVINPGDEVTFTMTWSVGGTSPITNLILVDPIPDNSSFVSASDNGVYDAQTNLITWELGNHVPGDTGQVTMTVASDSPLSDGTIITNTGTLDSDETDPSVSASASVLIQAGPVLSIVKTVSETTVNPGQTISYTVIITNSGNDTAYNVVLTDTLPTGFTFADTGEGTKSYSLGDLAIDSSISTTYDVVVGEDVDAGLYENLAVASSDNYPDVSDDVSVEVIVPIVFGEKAPILTIVKTVDAQFANPGSTVTYTVVVENIGDGEAENVMLQDLLPAGFSFPNGTVTKTWELGDLLPGESRNISYDVVIDETIKAGTYDNLAVTWADNHDNVTTTVPLEVREVQVLAAEDLPVKGGGLTELAFLSFGIFVVLFVGGALWVTRKEQSQ
ncbi:CARDB domain-containing protein [Patescibacteria group bacterium]